MACIIKFFSIRNAVYEVVGADFVKFGFDPAFMRVAIPPEAQCGIVVIFIKCIAKPLLDPYFFTVLIYENVIDAFMHIYPLKFFRVGVCPRPPQGRIDGRHGKVLMHIIGKTPIPVVFAHVLNASVGNAGVNHRFNKTYFSTGKVVLSV